MSVRLGARTGVHHAQEYSSTEECNLILLTETSSQKWQDLLGLPKISLCLFSPEHAQIVVGGEVNFSTILERIGAL